MNLTVFGANGRVGRHVVRQALDRGHMVVAFVHSHDPFDSEPGPRVVAGEVGDTAAVAEAMSGTDGVVSALGAFRRGTGPVLTAGMQTVTGAMRALGVRRIVTLTGAAAVVDGGGLQLRSRLNTLILSVMDRTAVSDSVGHLRVLRSSGLDWTTVCSPTITPEGPPDYLVRTAMPSLSAKVSGPAVAACLIDLVEGSHHVGEAVGIHQKR